MDLGLKELSIQKAFRLRVSPWKQLENTVFASEIPTFRSAANWSAQQFLHSTDIFPNSDAAECATRTILSETDAAFLLRVVEGRKSELSAAPHFQLLCVVKIAQKSSGHAHTAPILYKNLRVLMISQEYPEHGRIAFLQYRFLGTVRLLRSFLESTGAACAALTASRSSLRRISVSSGASRARMLAMLLCLFLDRFPSPLQAAFRLLRGG